MTEMVEVLHMARADVDALLRAAFAVWQHNGHDVPGALLHVHRHGASAGLRAAAGDAYDRTLGVRWLWEVVERDFAARLTAERHAG